MIKPGKSPSEAQHGRLVNMAAHVTFQVWKSIGRSNVKKKKKRKKKKTFMGAYKINLKEELTLNIEQRK